MKYSTPILVLVGVVLAAVQARTGGPGVFLIALLAWWMVCRAAPGMWADLRFVFKPRGLFKLRRGSHSRDNMTV